jgi:hypothetical protein
MTDLTDPRLIYAKGLLFLAGGIMAVGVILLEQPQWKIAMLLAIAIWCFARCYYWAFYVIEHYVDPSYKFAGLWSFIRYLIRRKTRPHKLSP